MSRREEKSNEIRKEDKSRPLFLESHTGVWGVWDEGKSNLGFVFLGFGLHIFSKVNFFWFYILMCIFNAI